MYEGCTTVGPTSTSRGAPGDGISPTIQKAESHHGQMLFAGRPQSQQHDRTIHDLLHFYRTALIFEGFNHISICVMLWLDRFHELCVAGWCSKRSERIRFYKRLQSDKRVDKDPVEGAVHRNTIRAIAPILCHDDLGDRIANIVGCTDPASDWLSCNP